MRHPQVTCRSLPSHWNCQTESEGYDLSESPQIVTGGLLTPLIILASLGVLFHVKNRPSAENQKWGGWKRQTHQWQGAQWGVTKSMAAKEKQKLPCRCVRNVNLVPQGKLKWCSVFFFKRWGEIHSISRQSRCSNRQGKLTAFYRKRGKQCLIPKRTSAISQLCWEARLKHFTWCLVKPGIECYSQSSLQPLEVGIIMPNFMIRKENTGTLSHSL